MTIDPQSDPARLQSRSVDRARRRRLLHRDLDVRVVSRRADPSLARSRALAAATRPLSAREPARTCSAIPTRAASGRRASPRRRAVLSDLHRREALRPHDVSRGVSGASLRDFHNYLVTSPTIDGDWSDPVYLNSSGFDPSLFHDDDGRKYCVNMLWDHRPGKNRFAGIVAQEYSPPSATLVGERREDLRGHGDRLHRSAASLQAQRLLLSAHRRGRHRLGPRGDDGALADDRRALRAASRTRTS